MLLKVLIEKLEDKNVQKSQMSAFIGEENNLKLQPLGADGIFLNKLLFHFEDITADDIVKRSQNHMYMAKKNFLAFASSLDQKQIEEKIIFIRDRLEVLVFNVVSQAQAVKMFSIINDRGLPLRILDKTKSMLMLYSTLHLEEELNDKINNSFENIFDSYDDLLVFKDRLGILGRFEENTVFTHHYFSARFLFPATWHNRDSADTVFAKLKVRCEEFKDDKNALSSFIDAYLDDFEQFAVSYSSRLFQNFSFWNSFFEFCGKSGL
jgi:hypothetical protein